MLKTEFRGLHLINWTMTPNYFDIFLIYRVISDNIILANNFYVLKARFSRYQLQSILNTCPTSVRRQQLCTGKCAGSVDLSDRLLLWWILRADRICTSANHAEGLRLQVSLRAGNEGGRKGHDRQESWEQDGIENGGCLLQEDRWVLPRISNINDGMFLNHKYLSIIVYYYVSIAKDYLPSRGIIHTLWYVSSILVFQENYNHLFVWLFWSNIPYLNCTP